MSSFTLTQPFFTRQKKLFATNRVRQSWRTRPAVQAIVQAPSSYATPETSTFSSPSLSSHPLPASNDYNDYAPAEFSFIYLGIIAVVGVLALYRLALGANKKWSKLDAKKEELSRLLSAKRDTQNNFVALSVTADEQAEPMKVMEDGTELQKSRHPSVYFPQVVADGSELQRGRYPDVLPEDAEDDTMLLNVIDATSTSVEQCGSVLQRLRHPFVVKTQCVLENGTALQKSRHPEVEPKDQKIAALSVVSFADMDESRKMQQAKYLDLERAKCPQIPKIDDDSCRKQRNAQAEKAKCPYIPNTNSEKTEERDE